MKRFVAKPAALPVEAPGMLSACVPRSLKPDPSRPSMCKLEYQPVCGQRGNSPRTFSNACLARADGFRIAHEGGCR